MIHWEFVIFNSKFSSAVLCKGRWKASNDEPLGGQWTTPMYLHHPATVPISEPFKSKRGGIHKTQVWRLSRPTAVEMIPEVIQRPTNSHWVTPVGEVLGIQREMGPLPSNKITPWRADSCASVTISQRTTPRVSTLGVWGGQWDPEEAYVCSGGSFELRLTCSEWEEGVTSSGEITTAQAQRCEKGC